MHTQKRRTPLCVTSRHSLREIIYKNKARSVMTKPATRMNTEISSVRLVHQYFRFCKSINVPAIRSSAGHWPRTENLPNSRKWKTTSIQLLGKMEDDLNLKLHKRWPQFASPTYSWAWHSSAPAFSYKNNNKMDACITWNLEFIIFVFQYHT